MNKSRFVAPGFRPGVRYDSLIKQVDFTIIIGNSAQVALYPPIKHGQLENQPF